MDQLPKIEEYIQKNARPIDKAFYEFHAHNGSPEAVFDALRPYQNADGGFGNALEPDMRLPHSTSIATWFAFQYIKDISDDSDNEMINCALDHLVQTFNEEKNGWPVVVPEVDQYPHASWWEYDSAIAHFGWGNPAAEMLGLFMRYGKKSHQSLITSMTKTALERVTKVPSSDFHEIFCFKALYELADVDLQSKLKQPLFELISEAVSTDSLEWNDYVATPLKFINGPDDPFASLFDQSLIEQNIEFIMSKLIDDHWEPNWSWQDQYPEEWEITKQEWSGELTVRNTLQLLKFT